MYRLTLFATVCTFGLMGAASAAKVQFEASLDTKSEVPTKVGDGTGQALATLDTATKVLSYTVIFHGLTGPAAAAHFHGPAASGVNAGVAIPIGGKGPESPVSGTATLTDAQIKDLEAGMWYVNVHTAANPGGEIRGQVMKEHADGMPMKHMKDAMPMKDGMPMKDAMPMKH